MIELSFRNKFESPTRFAVHPTVRIGTGVGISLRDLAERVKGRRVLILIHGYHADVSDGMDVYATIESTLRERKMLDESGKTPGAYERVIGLGWPSASLYLAFLFAWKRAAIAGERLAQIADGWEPKSIDVWTHSLGARVALEANAFPCFHIRNLIMTEPAVGSGVLNRPNGEYYQAACDVTNILVCYSQHDQVLRWAFRASRLTNALGLNGPGGPTGANVISVNCSADVDCHGAPKRSEVMFDEWSRILQWGAK